MENALKAVVYADTFYQCPTKRAISSQIHEENRMTVLYDVIENLGASIKDGSLESLFQNMALSYKDEWFPYDYVKSQTVKDDISVFRRFVAYLAGESIIDTYKKVSTETFKNKVTASVSFISKKDNTYYANIVRYKKADKSPNGKSLHTNSQTDLSAMVAKAALERDFPGIQIRLVYLPNEADSLGNIGKFVSCTTKKSNVFINDYSSYYEDNGSFAYEAFLSKIDEVIGTKVEPNCFNCENKALCQKNTINAVNVPCAREEELVPCGYVMPEFTQSQLQVINNTEGALLICAGPGSGKTATIVGRIKNLLDKGIPPEFILAITFTKEAANELKERCLSFCKPYELPEIMTLNALGYQILKLNPQYCGEVRLMTQRDRLTLIDSLLDVTAPLEGFSYSVIKGNNGLLAKVDKALIAYDKGEGEYKDDFKAFAETFKAAVKCHNYITYDEQISLSQKLFDEHPDILDSISSRYQYIMVDEFQDIDNAQAKFIYSLSQKYCNICAVGDDDQSIYAFRGGTNKYMLHFKRLYPDAMIYTLKENFRSTEKILNAANKQIEGNKRIKKEIRPVKSGGVEPIHIPGQSKDYLESIVNELVSQGIAYEDIAVIASKNSTLQNLQREVSFPSILGREFLVDNPFFKVLNFALGQKYCTVDASRCTVYLKGFISDEATLSKLSSIGTDCLAVEYVDQFSDVLGISDSAVISAIQQVITKYHIRDCKSLYELVQYMADYGDETRIMPETKGNVIFITSHESKGMEWKVVLMVDDYREEKTEEQNRLIYVAMTRAADLLYVFDNEKRSVVAA